MGCTSLVLAALLSLQGGGQKDTSPAPTTFQENRAWADLLKQLSFGPRVPGTPAHIKCRDWISDQLKASCDNVRFQELQHTWSQNGKTIKMWNVLGEQNWKDSKVHVVLFAHWDTRPMASQEENEYRRSRPIPGANDGASGVAVLLELARVLKETHPEVGIQYVFTDGEDLGPELNEMFLGARAYAKQLGANKPDYGILLDMIGDKNLTVPMEPNSMSYARDVVYELYSHAARVGLGGTFPMTQGPTIEDDHIPINQAGLPTVDLIDFSYPAWHTLDDTADKCSAQSLGKVGKLLQTWLERKPAYTPKK
jgi:Zn-dependent M28 family amino/carboxypeptidase